MIRLRGFMSVTIKEIAQRANVAISTVSYVLNNKSGAIKASPETREKILNIAKELNYTPSIMAKGLREGKTYLAGVMLDKINSSFVAEVLQGIEDVFHRNNYSMILSSHDGPEDFKERLSQMERKKIDGLITIKLQGDKYLEICNEFLKKNIPIVSGCIRTTLHGIPSVYVDEAKIGSVAAEYIFNSGHRNVLIANSGRPKCLDAFRFFWTGKGLDLPDKSFMNGYFTFDDGKEIIRKIKSDNLHPDVVFAHSDNLAAGMIYEAQKFGIKIPEDISILGIDNMPICTMVNPSITTVAQPQYEQGVQAAELLLSRTHGNVELKDIVIDPFLIERESFINRRNA